MGVVFLLGSSRESLALGHGHYVETVRGPGSFTIADGQNLTGIYVDASDDAGVARAAADLQADIVRVTGRTPIIVNDASNSETRLGRDEIIIGTVGKSAIIDQLIKEHKIDATAIAGQWESFFVQVVPKPLPGVANALVIAGSDKRGTIFGIYDLSEKMGVSPWYWWADVPVRHRDALFVRAGRFVQGPPKVKYRGIFINDEEPALGPWSREKFGGVNSRMYAHMFELILRLKGNYLWPAMWGKSFTED